MRIIVLGGFLGSGKTTILMRIANTFIGKGRKVAVLVNDVGEIGVDGKTLAAEGYNTTELPDGCVCCSLKSELQIAVRNVARDLNPDIMLIEPTGLALPHKVKELVRISMIEEDSDVIIGICDIQRFRDLIKKKEEFFSRQMQGSEFILINKADVAQPGEIEEATKWLSERFPDKPIIPVSVKDGTNLEKVYELIK